MWRTSAAWLSPHRRLISNLKQPETQPENAINQTAEWRQLDQLMCRQRGETGSIWARAGGAILLKTCCCAWDHCSVEDPTSAYGLWRFLETTLGSDETKIELLSPSMFRGVKLRLSNTRARHYIVHMTVGGVCAEMLWLVFFKHGALHYDQTSST
ncbi:hypothetical protein ILYODFUR_024712 [Ilyodon furcidens]|uniref:Uncharacterized protein n=1 Tax=Ilyodon furcidens TaxID=33524 RepID=A0ABV0UK65_9TELE